MASQPNTDSKTFDYGDFYWMSQGYCKGEIRVDSRDSIDAPLDLLYGIGIPAEPVEFRRIAGNRRFDVIPSTYAAIRLVSRRFVKVLEAGRFTGWRVWPASIVGIDTGHIVDYAGLSILGRCGPIDTSRCARVWRQAIPGGKHYLAWFGMYFDPTTWDGSDLFCPDGSSHVIATSRVKIALERATLTNVAFIALPDVEQQVWRDG